MAKKTHDTNTTLFDSRDTPAGMPAGYYSGDQPNSNLRSLIGEHATPYDQGVDDYNVGPFTQPITTTKATALYNMHTYWSKKPHDAIRQYVRHYTEPGDVVLDPFCGSGGTALAALMEGRTAVALDRSPSAIFITKNYCTPVSISALREAFAQAERIAYKELQWLYETRCDRCKGSATVTKTVYSTVFQCPRCLSKVPLFDCAEVKQSGDSGTHKTIAACPVCYNKGHVEEINARSEKFGSVPVMVFYSCRGGCTPASSERRHNDADKSKRRYFADYDLGRLSEIDSATIPHWYPKGYSMKGFSRYQRDALFYYGVEEVADLFTKRNRWALAAWLNAFKSVPTTPEIRDMLRFVFTANLFSGSRLQQFHEGGGGFQRGTYYIPQLSLERNQVECMKRKLVDVCNGIAQALQADISSSVICSTQSSVDISHIGANTIDYIFTDPAYSHTVQYGELNYVWEAWLEMDTTWHAEEIVVNYTRGISEADWADRMRRAMSECFRVLKPGRWLSLCYHDTSEGTWELVQDVMAEVGFVVDKTDSTLFIETHEKSSNQRIADKVTKRDLLLNFRKPKPGEWRVTQTYIPADADIATFSELARQILQDFLIAHPGATKDRIYDALVSSMVRQGQMEAHDFDTVLKSVAEEVKEPIKKDLFSDKDPNLFGTHVQSRWYLKETADQVDQAERAKEDAAAACLTKFIGVWLKKRPELEGAHYSDLFEQFLPLHDKPRRLLADWLPEYFIKTPSGTWRLPDKEEASQLLELREAGTLRRIKRFANALIEGVPVREKDRPGSDVNLLDWLRQCRRAGLYEQGKAIYEKGGMNSASLSDQQQIEAEDDYRICARRGTTEEAKPKRQRRKKQDADE